MPELPEVEVFRRYVDSTSLHRRVEHLRVYDEKLLDGVSRQKLVAALVGASFQETARHGKVLGIHSGRGAWLLLHFGMTGDVEAGKRDGEPPEFTALAAEFENGMRLAYTNARRFGKIGLVEDFAAYVEGKELGPDALDIDLATFRDVLDDRRGGIKSALMNQQAIAGLGNEWSDEVLFQAGIRPDRSIDDLDDHEVKALHRQIARVMPMAIERKCDPDRMPRTWLRPRREEGGDCPRCDGRIEKMEVSGRATYWCPACQS